jgi:hypothetical protein
MSERRDRFRALDTGSEVCESAVPETVSDLHRSLDTEMEYV